MGLLQAVDRQLGNVVHGSHHKISDHNIDLVIVPNLCYLSSTVEFIRHKSAKQVIPWRHEHETEGSKTRRNGGGWPFLLLRNSANIRSLSYSTEQSDGLMQWRGCGN